MRSLFSTSFSSTNWDQAPTVGGDVGETSLMDCMQRIDTSGVEKLVNAESAEISQAMKVLRTLKQQQTRGEGCDIVLQVSDKEYKAHTAVLVASSPYFEALLRSGMKESVENRVELHGISNVAMEIVLQYMYSGCIDVDLFNALEVLVAADLFLMTSLKSMNEHFLSNNIDTENCLFLRALSQRFHLAILLMNCNKFLQKRENLKEIVSGEEILDLGFDHFHDIITCDVVSVTVDNEEALFELIVKWTEFNRQSREDHFPALLSSIRLPLMEKEYFLNKVERQELVKKFPSCAEYVQETLRYWVSPGRKTSLDNSLLQHRLGRMVDVILLCGGRDCRDRVRRDVVAYVIDYDAWAVLTPLPTFMSSHAAVTLDEKVYVGGALGTVTNSKLFCFDPVKNTWNSLPPMHYLRDNFTLCACAGKLYAIGGKVRKNLLQSDECIAVATVERFDPITHGWDVVGSMGTPRSFAKAVSINDKYIYVSGGEPSHNSTPFSVEYYMCNEDKWMPLKRINQQRNGLSPPPLLNLGDQLYIAYLNGENTKLSPYQDWKVDKTIPKLPIFGTNGTVCRHESAVCSLDSGGIFVCGGWNDNLGRDVFNQKFAYIWNPASGSNKWQKLSPPPTSGVDSAIRLSDHNLEVELWRKSIPKFEAKTTFLQTMQKM
ncbi:kelch-like protein 28 [Saccoglossus kowalevskii]|uniref:Kelch-like protein 3-like n=1 Tax=Saccoglossus kowalevskii TaxID=10224 RepID=A0ABM0GSI3_SACKO|nr:PREDICTED: kelch-like protein 3-like [Saccoglossus kowalevskii]